MIQVLRKACIAGVAVFLLLAFVEFESGYLLYHREHKRVATFHAAAEIFKAIYRKQEVPLPWRIKNGKVVWEARDKNPFIQAGRVQTYQFHPLIDYTGAFSWDVIQGHLDYFGYRNDRDYYFESSEDPLIVITGGSEIAGGHHPITIAQHLEKQLTERTNKKWRVLNLAMHSYTLPNEINSFVQLGYNLHPKYVITHSGWNDLLYSLMVPHPFQKVGLSYYKYVESWFRRLYTLSLNSLDTTWSVDLRNKDLAVGNYLRNLEKYQKIVEGSGALFIAGLQPYNKKHREGSDIDRVYEIVHKLHDEISAKASDRSLVTFESSGINFLDSIHSDWPGAEIIASRYADTIEQREHALAQN